MSSESKFGKSVSADDDKFFHRKGVCQSCEHFRQSFCMEWYWGCARVARDEYKRNVNAEKPSCPKWKK